jgi:hypothetical protein
MPQGNNVEYIYIYIYKVNNVIFFPVIEWANTFSKH